MKHNTFRIHLVIHSLLKKCFYSRSYSLVMKKLECFGLLSSLFSCENLHEVLWILCVGSALQLNLLPASFRCNITVMILCNKLTLSVPQKNQWLSHGSHLQFLKQPSMTAIRWVQILAIAVCALLSFKLQTVGPRLASSEMLEICL
jgi:hypothetical protein